MTENELSYKIRGATYNVYKILGPGLLENAYETALCYELREMGLSVERQISLPLRYKGVEIDGGYRIDLMVEEKVIIEVKSIAGIAPVHHKQLLTYLKLTNLKLGLLINFNVEVINSGITRIVNGL